MTIGRTECPDSIGPDGEGIVIPWAIGGWDLTCEREMHMHV